MATLALRGVSKSFGATRVLSEVGLEIADKEFVVFVGPSGCGKTTLLRIIAGLEDASSGRLEIDGKDVSDAHPLERGVAMVFQSYALYPHLDVFENIAFPLRVAKLPEAEVKEKVEKAADILQLRDRLDFKPRQLSGGQRQRVAIGRAIVRQPQVFLFDEPLSNLDAALRGEMRVELSKLHQRLDATMVYVTHDQVEAMTMADRIVVLSEGVVQQYGSPLQLYHHPANRFVAGFIGHPTMNFLPAAAAAGCGAEQAAVEAAGLGQLKLPVDAAGVPAGEKMELGVRPDDFELADGAGDGTLALRIDVLEKLGSVSLAYGTGAGAKLCAALPGDAGLKEGTEARLRLPPAACHLFRADGTACRRLQAPAAA
ncbi:MAG: sn-glycerol-3-phosphate ABC transporter ATP-binding protein UgpC [Betaproteobacteria bacterium AqS2]|uniref:Sn-glycerol-3-phosphate ABC transporter ATP-binding protein UgpC n=1 Tax=Candidatus Amphirhobacter heronislandensis TaxID=1732024 RepID=A0A930XXM8_9GAMM|nr:sn-glycerol-3-phosphate ABC transporter ATP-binding protein UgpC [Betaproteobacteria bacterium AqS2]